ncbi:MULTISPECIES: hypothetical protein [unclassified Pseudoalteromonas]|uniref:hypothetical protein n=1 Tax=unclassified Pseudoalteromonas TaxID=194690 RepID=UPI0013FD28CD|nr:MULTISPECIES: hypothetical protein [unclassified Pseudoalteromonas]MBH0049340.1 hypothetical protein [Pseudoalteromonas sp. SWYJZ19]
MSTQLRIFKADAGLKWLKAGWLIFKTQPATFIAMFLFIGISNLFFAIVLPQKLQVLALLPISFLTIGFYRAVLTKQQGGKIILFDIFKVFSSTGNRIGLFRLALIQMSIALVLEFLAKVLFLQAEAVINDPNTAAILSDPNITMPQITQLFQSILSSIPVINMILFLIALFVYLASFAYAGPLVYFNNEQSILTALKKSLMVFYHNILPLGVFGLICALFMALSMFLSFLPLLILMPICYISFFVSYQAIFMPVVPPSDDINVKPLSSEESGRFDA